MNITVLGAGAWGTALAKLLREAGHEVTLWAHDPAHLAALRETGVNERHLPGVRLPGAVEQSATVDEESGGFAGVAYLAARGYLSAARQQHVIITEPHGPERICLGHRGAWWFDVTVHGHIAHGSMPFNGVNAVDRMADFLTAVTARLRPALAARHTAMPVEPAGARQPTLNVNSIFAGQGLTVAMRRCSRPGIRSPCMAICRAND